jgi:hypothetical protein
LIGLGNAFPVSDTFGDGCPTVSNTVAHLGLNHIDSLKGRLNLPVEGLAVYIFKESIIDPIFCAAVV